MLVTSLRLQNFRIHDDITIDFSPRTTIITGTNGTGKTSVAEAVYISLTGKSFKGTDKDIVRYGADWYRIDTHTSLGARQVKFQEKKRFEIDHSAHLRLPQTKRYPVILFDPDELRLFHGSPARRREYIDRLLSMIDVRYAQYLYRYERALKQRNTALKQRQSADALFSWNITLAEYGEYIAAKRNEIIVALSENISAAYALIANKSDKIAIHYPKEQRITKQTLLARHEQAYERDSMLGHTSNGPHRDDILFYFNTRVAGDVASRGEVRSSILALKAAEVELVKKYLATLPLVIFDDVYSELDEIRQARITEYMQPYQTIITSVDIPGGIQPHSSSQIRDTLRVHHL